MVERTGTLDSEQRTEIESFVVDWMIDNHVPGTSVAIVNGDETVYAEGFGARDLGTNAPATADTLYGIGSCTKSFTSLSVMQLVERDDIELSDPINAYIPVLEDVSGDPITVEQLLTHTSGMPSDDMATVLIPRTALGSSLEVPLSSRADFHRHVDGAADHRVTDTGEHFMYYNSGYVLLGHLIEAVSDQSYPAYIEQHVLEPLGMDRSTFTREDFDAESDTMTPYYREDEQSQASEVPFDEFIDAAGGLLSSVAEVASFLSSQLRGDGLPDISADTLATMYRPRATMWSLLDGTEIEYGCGWMIEPLLGDTLVGHGGSTGVSSAYFGGLRDAGIGVAIACNDGSDVMTAAKGILAILQGQTPEQTIPALMLDEKYSQVTGEYTSYRGLQSVTVERDGPSLHLTQEMSLGGQTLPLIPERLAPDDYAFYTVSHSGMRQSVEFYVDSEPMELSIERSRFRKQ